MFMRIAGSVELFDFHQTAGKATYCHSTVSRISSKLTLVSGQLDR